MHKQFTDADTKGKTRIACSSSLSGVTRAFHYLTSCMLVWIGLFLASAAPAHAQQKETSVPLSQRMTINLSAGIPQYIANAASNSNAPQSQWWYENSKTSATYASTTFVESTDSSANWQQVGLPYDANVTRTFINQTSGGGQGSLTGNDNWYRLHFKVDAKYAGTKVPAEPRGHAYRRAGVHQRHAAEGYQPGGCRRTGHARGRLRAGRGRSLRLTCMWTGRPTTSSPWMCRAGPRGSKHPTFSGAFRFGQAMAGLFRNVFLIVTNPVHIPLNVYSNTPAPGALTSAPCPRSLRPRGARRLRLL